MSETVNPTAPTLAKSDQNLVWLDCEMSGLDPEKEYLLEIALDIKQALDIGGAQRIQAGPDQMPQAGRGFDANGHLDCFAQVEMPTVPQRNAYGNVVQAQATDDLFKALLPKHRASLLV